MRFYAMQRLARFLIIVCLVVFSTAGRAQNPGQGVSVNIELKSVIVRGDTIGVKAQVTNLGSSRDSLLTYMVDAPSGVTQILRPSPASDWFTLSAFRSRPMATWISGQTVPPGGTSPDLYFESIGVPAIVTYWAEGEHEPPDLPDAPESALATDPLTTEMVNGKTVGVMPWPVDRSAAGLLSRLRGLTQSACASPTVWITDSTLCAQLTSDLDQAETFRANGQTTEARNSLDNFKARLAGPNGTFAADVSSSGYWLLVPNADIVKNSL